MEAVDGRNCFAAAAAAAQAVNRKTSSETVRIRANATQANFFQYQNVPIHSRVLGFYVFHSIPTNYSLNLMESIHTHTFHDMIFPRKFVCVFRVSVLVLVAHCRQ